MAAVCFRQGDVQAAATYSQGRLPTILVGQFSSDQAFIHLVEAWSTILAPIVFERWLNQCYIQGCDNEASRHALIKGVGRHQPLNCLVAAHWIWQNRRGLAHRLERVPTKANIRRCTQFLREPRAVSSLTRNSPPTQSHEEYRGHITIATSHGFSNIPEPVPVRRALEARDQ